MQHPFPVLRPEYDALLSTCVILRSMRDAVDEVVSTKIIPNMPRYIACVAGMAVPAADIAVLHQRESSGNFSTYLGNGEPLDRVTRLVPKGRGPFLDPRAWEKGAADAIGLDHLDDNSAPWSVAYALWKDEAYNGFGPRSHGRHSGYLWAGTNVYNGGKYVADGVWDANAWDKQIGVVPLLMRIAEVAPQFAIPGMPEFDNQQPIPAPMPAPEGVGGGAHDTAWLQTALNRFGAALQVDGSYGRRTREAVRAFQSAHNVVPFDGLAGPRTFQAIETALGA